MICLETLRGLDGPLLFYLDDVNFAFWAALALLLPYISMFLDILVAIIVHHCIIHTFLFSI